MKLFVFPGNLSPEVRALGQQEVPYARTPAFGSMVLACHQRLATLADADDGEVLSFTASGTGAAECLLGGWGPRWRRLLVLHAGTFGRRWLDMARHLRLPVDDIAWEPHAEPPWPIIERTLASRSHDTVMAVHHETSTGELLDLSRLGTLCRAADTRLLVDAIGSFLADELTLAAWGVDAALLSSQKGLCLPPGLAFLITRPALGPPAPQSLSWYFDPQLHRDSFARGQPPWSPAAQLYAQLDQRLSTIEAHGGASGAQAMVDAKASTFRAAVAELGWSVAARHPSACITALQFNAPATAMVQDLAREGWFVLPSPDPRLVRVAHLGEADLQDHVDLARRLAHHAARHSLLSAPAPDDPIPAHS
jgi:aspartate aminotransferase-like enzyme